MPKRDKLFQDMQGNNQAVLLVAQVGAMPGELQLILETARLDEDAGQLYPLNNYIIRVLGVEEFRITSLGTTVGDVRLVDNHPLLYQYNEAPAAVFFRGKPADVNELIIDISQAHATTFQGWRQFPDYLNVSQPLVDLLESGGGLIGQMPDSLAQRMVKVLGKHHLEHMVKHGVPLNEVHDNPMLRQQKAQALMIGESYFIANTFSIEEMGRV